MCIYREFELRECECRLRFFFLLLLRSLESCDRFSYLFRTELLDTVDVVLLGFGIGDECDRMLANFTCVSLLGLFISANCIPSFESGWFSGFIDIGFHKFATKPGCSGANVFSMLSVLSSGSFFITILACDEFDVLRIILFKNGFFSFNLNFLRSVVVLSAAFVYSVYGQQLCWLLVEQLDVLHVLVRGSQAKALWIKSVSNQYCYFEIQYNKRSTMYQYINMESTGVFRFLSR